MQEEYTEETWPTQKWPNFSFREIACRETGLCFIDPDLMNRLQALRELCGFALIVTSAYRAPTHTAERDKSTPGTHAQGLAVDIQVSGEDAYIVLVEALQMEFTGIGVQQKGEHRTRFLHLDISTAGARPTLFSY